MKLYIVVPKTLSIEQQAVQAGHAAVDFVLRNPESEWRGHSLIYLTVDTEEELGKLYDEAQGWCQAEIGWFHEPYWNNKLTAVAVYGAGEKLKSLPLMRGQK